MAQSKYGIFEGQATLKVPNLGVYTGFFKNNLVNGPGKMTFSDGRDPVEGMWQNLGVEDLTKHFQADK